MVDGLGPKTKIDSTDSTRLALKPHHTVGPKHLREISTNDKALCTQRGAQEKELEERPESTAMTTYGAYTMAIGFQSDAVKLNMVLAAYLPQYDEVGLWLADESKRPGRWVIVDESSNADVS